MAIYRVPIELQNANLPSWAYNIWHLRTTAAGAEIDTAIAALYAFYDSLKGYLAPSTTVVFPSAVVEVTDDTEASVGNVPLPINSTGTSAAPPGLAVTFSWKTSIRARRGRGRTFLGPLSQSVFDSSGRTFSTFHNAAGVAAQELIDQSELNLNEWAFGVYGQQNAGLEEPKVLRDFTGFDISRKLAHLRTRRD